MVVPCVYISVAPVERQVKEYNFTVTAVLAA